MKKFVLALAAAAFVAAFGADPVAAYKLRWWKAGVSEGYWNDPENWSGGELPGGDYYGAIDLSQMESVRLKAPPEGLVENSPVYMKANTSSGTDHTMIYDTRGTFWEKKGVKAAQYWFGWSCAGYWNGMGNHIFNLEGLPTAANESVLLRMEDGEFAWTSSTARQLFEARSGKLKINYTLMVGSNGRTYFEMHPGTETDIASLQIRGNNGAWTTYWGGTHRVGWMQIRDSYCSGGHGVRVGVTVTNDAELTVSGDLHVANRWFQDGGGVSGELLAGGSSRLTVGGTCYAGSGADSGTPNDSGRFLLFDDAEATIKRLVAGRGNGCTGVVEVTGRAALRAENAVVAAKPKAWGEMRVIGGGALAEVSGTISCGCDSTGYGELEVKDGATLRAGAIIGAAEGAEAQLRVRFDGAKVAALGGAEVFMKGCAAKVGAGGFELEVGERARIEQGFENEAGTDGLVEKTGEGVLTVGAASGHRRTRVSAGGIALDGVVGGFGEEMTFAEGTELQFAGAGAKLRVRKLEAEGRVRVRMARDLQPGTTVTAIEVEEGMTEETFGRLDFAPVAGLEFAAALSADGKTVTVAVDGSAGTVKTWAGGSAGDWHGAGNWTGPEGNAAPAPRYADEARVEGSAAITLAGTGYAKKLEVTGDGTVATVGGEGWLQTAERIEVGAGARLEASVKVQDSGDALVKTGKGTLKLSGDNAKNLDGNIELREGVTEFATAAALGNASCMADLALSNNTFRYTGAEPAETMRKLRLGSTLPAVLDVQGDLRFRNFGVKYDFGDAAIVKTGGGTLRLDVPGGVTTLSKFSKAGRGGNNDIGGRFATVNGETANWDGAAQFTVLDGRVEIHGAGRSATTVNQQHHGGIGGSGVASANGAELFLKDLRYNQGSGSGFHILMDRTMLPQSKASRLILENADFYCNGIYALYGLDGQPAAGVTYNPVVAITNSKLEVEWQGVFPVRSANVKMTIIVAENGILRHSGKNYNTDGIRFNSEMDVRVESGGTIDVQNFAWLNLTSSAWGKMKFTGGGKLAVSRVVSASTAKQMDLEFDGGVASFSGSGLTSAAYNAGASGFVVGAGGMELQVAGSVGEHVVAIPLRGEGVARKTGGGTLTLTNALKSATAAADAGVVMVQNGGGLRVEEGVVKLGSAGVTDRGSRIAVGAGAALDLGGGEWVADALVGGPGEIRNGRFGGALKAATGEGEGPVRVDGSVTFEGGRVEVDFGLAADYAAVRPLRDVGVAVLGDGVEFGGVRWVAVNKGYGNQCTFGWDAAGRRVYATVRRGGLTIVFR